MKRTLNEKIYDAVQSGELVEPFTTQQLKNWVEEFKVLNDKSNKKYAKSSIDSVLSNADKKNKPTSNQNKKNMQSRINEMGVKEYFFA
jgi:hypothetical protein